MNASSTHGQAGRPGPNADELRARMRGQWPSTLAALGADPAFLDGKPGRPCPACGGTDRFHFTDRDGSGSYVCRGCGGGNDGFSLAGKLLRLDPKRDFPAILERVAELAGEMELGEPRERQGARTLSQDKGAMAAEKAHRIWNAAKPVRVDHPYLSRKGLAQNVMLREIPLRDLTPLLGYAPRGKAGALQGRILVAPVEVDGQLSTLEMIDEQGRKSALAGGIKAGGFWKAQSGWPPEPDTLLIGEGIATALSARLSMGGCPAVAALSSSNLAAVARELRTLFQKARLVILADLGPGEESARKAAAATGALLAVPDFGPERPAWAKDFNDMMLLHGRESVRLAIEAAAPVEGGPVEEKPLIDVFGGGLPQEVAHGEAVLLKHGSVYQQGGALVRLVTLGCDESRGGIMQHAGATVVRRVEASWLGLELTRIASWRRTDRGSPRPIDAPAEVVQAILGHAGSWPFPELAGVIEAPTLRRDGTILDAPGYDEKTGLFLTPHAFQLDMRRLGSPTQADARQAIERLKQPLSRFPFLTDGDRSVALSALLTATVRRSLPTAPLHGFSAPAPGSGKSLLVDLASVLATGRKAAVLNHGRTDEEFEKRLAAALLAGDLVVTVDNVSRPLGGDLLNQALTQEFLKVRPLGGSVQLTVPTTAMLFATGKNLIFPEDMVRRTLLCTIDPGCERPELRNFDFNPVDELLTRRNEFLQAALLILRAFIMAGRPGMKLTPLGGFTEWSGWIRAALVWLGEADPCQTIEAVRGTDPELQRLQAVLAAWHEVFGNRRVSVQEIIREISRDSRSESLACLREALLNVAGDGGMVNSCRLGNWLSTNKRRITNGKLFEEAGVKNGLRLWVVTEQDSVFSGLSVFSSHSMREENNIQNNVIYNIEGTVPHKHTEGTKHTSMEREQGMV